MNQVSVKEVRGNLAELFNRVVYGGERIIIIRHNKPVAAMISIDDLKKITIKKEKP